MKKWFQWLLIAVLMLLLPSVPLTAAAPAKNHSLSAQAEKYLSQMSPREKIGQMVMPATFDDERQMPNNQTKEIIQKYKAGSVILFGKRSKKTTVRYNNQLQEWAKGKNGSGIPLFIGADFEYGAADLGLGAVQRYPDESTMFPRQMGTGATKSERAAQKVSKITAIEAKALGVNWNFSPLADVNTNPENPVIGVRSFGSHPDLVSKMTAAQVRTLQGEGIMSSAKHFPGHGNTGTDSHTGLPEVKDSLADLEKTALPPFKSAIKSGVSSIMTAHVIVDAIDPKLPATLSPKVLNGFLRDKLHFKGIIITDAMNMGAIKNNYGAGEAAVMAVKAGADMIMATGTYEEQVETFQSLYDAYLDGEIPNKRLDSSVKRILIKKLEYKLFQQKPASVSKALKTVGSKQHMKIAKSIAAQSITLLKDNSVLPLKKNAGKKTMIASVVQADTMANEVKRVSNDKVMQWQSESQEPTSEEIQKAAAIAKDADRIIVGTHSKGQLPKAQAQLVEALKKTGKPVIAVSLGLPYDIKDYEKSADAYLASYALDKWLEGNMNSIEAAVDVIYGKQPGGTLPVDIPGSYPYGAGMKY
ncbi:glycoside hydrolase family 3 protein [Metabacillus sp. GX 13764]|uniref:glycoside hydrolase family 3 protein n=1 Tax=Metabacillus kandeliae TaxID=2900151 RepID=UPI001E5BDB88|nr:glycoside hydrolase family 3 protein [Metabacillus kandeliae]MCD7036066.1 glycoside hydrolase family 3 protein [Metabacillus kandeliae]